MNQLDATFGALADPTRRKVLKLLSRRELRAGELAQRLKLTPPSMSKHLKVLRDSRLVEIDSDAADARVKVYRLRRAGFREASSWLQGVERFWQEQLSDFQAFVERAR
jgi:DNA-binding transcriptional ArsR family regulator